MFKAIVVDDEPGAVDLLVYYSGSCENLKVCACCRSIPEAVAAINLHKPDVLFLDIELSDGLSFEILESFPDINTRIIFITAYEHYALKAIKFHAFDYLLKPLIEDEFRQVVNKVTGDIKEREPLPDQSALLFHLKEKIAVPSKNGLHYYSIDEIIAIEGEGSYSIMHLSGSRKVMITRKLKDFEETLLPKGFLRVHKSYLANINHIIELHRDDSGYLVMTDNTRIPISPKGKEEIISLIKQSSFLI